MSSNINIIDEDEQKELDEDEIRNYVLNENNIFITEKYVNGLLKKYGLKHKVKNLELYITSTTHTSYMIIDLEKEKNPYKKYSYYPCYHL